MEAHKFANIFPMIEGNELEVLKNDIKEHGLLSPVVLYEDKILDGRNRFKACKEMGIEPKFEYYTGDKPLEFVISLNLKRRHLTQSQAGVIALTIMPLLEEEARKRVKESGEKFGKGMVILPEPIKNKGTSSQQAGKLFNVSEKYVREAKKLKETSPEDFEEVRLGHKNFSEIRKEQRFEKIKEQRKEIAKLVPERKLKQEYDVIVIDPPWDYGTEESYDVNSFRGTTPYPTMSLEEIKKIKLPVAENCILWLWTTNLFMEQAHQILREWGFEKKSILTWDKKHIGTGRWLRSQTEHCILAVKGKPLWTNTTYSTFLSEMKTRNHSEKPEGFYKMLDVIHGDCAKLDYFARKKRDGWDVYGDEVEEKREDYGKKD